MPELPAALTKQVGPFPVVGWLAIGGAGIGLAIIIRRSDLFGGSGEVAPVDDVAAIDDPAAQGEVYAPANGQVGGTVPIPVQNQPGNVGPAPITTNADWSRRAVVWATTQADFDSIVASRAVAGYLQGDELTWAEGVCLDAIIDHLGPPPEGAPPPKVATPIRPPVPVLPGAPMPAPPASPPRAPATRPTPSNKGINITVASGDTFGKLAARYYGNASKAQLLWSMNRWVQAPAAGPSVNVLYAGKQLWLPDVLNDGTRRR